MASRNSFVADSAGIDALLTADETLVAFMTEKVDEVAGSLEGRVFAATDFSRDKTEVPVAHAMHVTDRIAGVVTLMHPAAVPLEAKYGYLAQAAEAAGFEWGRKSRTPRGGS